MATGKANKLDPEEQELLDAFKKGTLKSTLEDPKDEDAELSIEEAAATAVLLHKEIKRNVWNRLKNKVLED